ncbi:MAG TPA: DinB family protein [Bryobacteraceae bacterium]|nr:DinB family protein [Bryobacteraceae bacterium]HOQ46799.1 DinB family protein [Bryobacteraceae bacterium]HPQ15830.1 DinB family protein [Bryobacteraceae bacterium]HPU73589.1 DinB family protein [Bryobacteraceae bacterium]
MPIADLLLPEFDQEMANTRKVLERLPEDKFGWKPHPKSFTMGALATHVATVPYWAVVIMEKDFFDLAEPVENPEAKTTAELLERFDKYTACARAAIAGAADERMHETWSLRSGEKVVLAMPRIGVLRTLVMNHGIHHRAQLAMYLRLNDVPVPPLYGPSADEQAV